MKKLALILVWITTIRFYEWLLVVLIATMLALALFGCEKQERYISPPDPNVYWDKKVNFTGEKKVGKTIKFYVSAPPDFRGGKRRWMPEYGTPGATITNHSDTLYHIYKTAGTRYANVELWNSDNTKMLPGDAVIMQIRE